MEFRKVTPIKAWRWCDQFNAPLHLGTTTAQRLQMIDPQLLPKLLTTRMPFGKYEGRLIADLPGDYLNWFAREGFPKAEVGRLLALKQTIDHNGLRGLLDPLRSA
jgi:uncharacterized protein (DUF3820 family)